MKKILIIMMVAVVAVLGIWYVMKDDEVAVEPEPIENTVEKEEEIVSDGKTISIEAVDSSEFGVKETSEFKLQFSENVSEESVKKNLVIEPLTAFELEKVTDKEYIIKPLNDLFKNQVYVFNYDEFDYGKAFQVIDDLKVFDSYPRHDSTDIPTRSTIEFFFNSDHVVDVDAFFEITPLVEGEFKYEGEKVVFISTDLEPSTTYTVTLKNGLTDGDRMMVEDFSLRFTTSYNSQMSETIYYTIFNMAADESAIFKVHDWMNSNSYEVSIYRTESFDVFKEVYETFEESYKSLDLSEHELVMTEEVNTTIYNYNNYITLPELEYGRYIVEIKSGEATQYAFTQVDDHQVYYTKAVNGDMFWIIDNKNQVPADDAIVFNGLNEVGRTNETGLMFVETLDEDLGYEINIKGKGYLVKTTNPSMYFDDYSYYQTNSVDHWSFIYTDRQAYRMTDEINVFGYIRSFTDENIDEVTLKLTHYWAEEPLAEVTVKLDEEMTYSSKISLDNLDPGYYSLIMYHGDKRINSKEIIIDEFEKPEVYIKTSVDKKLVFSGETISYELVAKYFTELPFEGLGINLHYTNSQFNNEELKTDKNGKLDLDINVVSDRTDWQPSRYYISAENYTSTDTYIYNSIGIEVLPRTIMIQAEADSDKTTATVKVQTNTIDLSNFKGNYGKNYENIKGEFYDTSYDVVIKDSYTIKTFVETVYDPIHKTSYDKYDYDRKSTYIEGVRGATVNGVDTFTFPVEEFHSYEIEISALDTNGDVTTTRSNIYNSEFRIEYNSNSGSIYQYSEFENYYDLGDDVSFEVLKGGESIESKVDDFAVHMILKNGIVDYVYTDDPAYSFEFKKEHRPNIFIKTLYYDGNRVNVLPEYASQMIRYDYETLSYDITYDTDEASYGPSDVMTLNLDVSQGEKPFNGVINISVVDEAFFALYEDYFDLGHNLHSLIYSDGILVETYSGDDAVSEMGAEMGEGGDGDYIRDDFKDTAYFKAVKVVNGKATIEMALPDNLTSWRLTMQAVNKDLEYGSLKGNVIVSLPYFVRTLYNKKYITGDEVYVTLNSDGEALGDEKITYNAYLKRDGITLTESKLTTTGKGNVSLPIGVLEKGDYTIVVEGKTADYIDGVKEEILVRDTYVNFNHSREGALTSAYELLYPNRTTELIVYNKGALDYLEKIFDTRSYSRYRIEEVLAGFEANRVLADYFDVYEDYYAVDDYQDRDGGIRQLATGNTSVETTALILGTGIGVEEFDLNAMKRFMLNSLKETDIPNSKKVMSLWALSAIGEPVLLGVDAFMESHELEGRELLYVGLALADLGDKTRAVEIATQVLENTLYSKLTEKEKVLAGSLARKLNIEDKRFNGEFTLSIQSADTIALEKLYYISYLPVTFDSASITYSIDGVSKVAELPDLRAHRILLEDGKKIEFDLVSNNIQVTEIYEVTGLDYDDFDSQLYQITRNMPETVGIDDLVEVSYDYKKPSKKGAYIMDVIPAGFEFAGQKSKRDYSVMNNNQEIYMHLNWENETGTVTYYIRAIQAGKYNVETAYIRSYDGKELDMIDPTIIEVINE